MATVRVTHVCDGGNHVDLEIETSRGVRSFSMNIDELFGGKSDEEAAACWCIQV